MFVRKRSSDTPRVVILTSTVAEGLHDMLRGVLQYAQEHGPWRVYQQERRGWTSRLKNVKQWGCTGIVAADHHSVQEAKLIAGLGVPVVVLLQPQAMHQPFYPLFSYACVLWNSGAIGRMAARYFLDRRYTRFAFVGDTHGNTYWSCEREQGFRDVLRSAGYSHCRVYAPCTAAEQRDWAVERPRMETWLRALPQPIALFTPNDRRGKQVLDACLDAGLSVPDEIAVLSVDNDEWICEAAVPTLSSIRCDTHQAGYQVAEHLDRLMRGERLPKREYLVQPTSVVTRQSTDWMAVEDPRIARALTHIQKTATQPNLRVADIARTIGLSRRATEIRFRNATGRTVREEIEHVRLERLRVQLVETDLKIGEIARRCGFVCETHLERIFRQRFGITMRDYRRSPLPSETAERIFGQTPAKDASPTTDSQTETQEAQVCGKARFIIKAQVDREILKVCQADPRSSSEIAAALGHKTLSGNVRKALPRLKAADLLAYTVPSHPRSRFQKYRLTSAGYAALAAKRAD